MGGYYYKLINENDRRISVGLNSMLWHYNKDLSGYTLGQGVIIAHNNISHSHCLLITVNVLKIGHGSIWLSLLVLFKTDDSRRYPHTNLVSSDKFNSDPIKEIFKHERNIIDKGIRSWFGYKKARALIEQSNNTTLVYRCRYRYSASENYTPSHALMYLRYSFDGWNGDLDLRLTRLFLTQILNNPVTRLNNKQTANAVRLLFLSRVD